jgi:CRP-like cAMP-binding protein
MVSKSVPRVRPGALIEFGTLPTVEFRRAEVIFSPGDLGDSVMYIQCGGVKLSVRSKSGREAVVALLGPGDFLGEACLAGERTRIRSAIALVRSKIVVVTRHEMVRLLHEPPVLERLLSHVLARYTTLEQALIEQVFSSTENQLTGSCQ